MMYDGLVKVHAARRTSSRVQARPWSRQSFSAPKALPDDEGVALDVVGEERAG